MCAKISSLEKNPEKPGTPLIAIVPNNIVINVIGNAFFNVATAASITGFVRSYLFRSLLAVKNPVYCDTDSIMCSNGDKLDIGGNLGQWELESEANKISACKAYIYKERYYLAEIYTQCQLFTL